MTRPIPHIDPGKPSFSVADEHLRPPVCPSCGYSWQGLPHPQCPECGERVQDDEVVVIGISLNDRSSLSERNLHHDFLGLLFGAVVAGGLTLYLQGINAAGIIAIAGASLIGAAAILVYARLRRRWGIPKGVLRISSRGFRIGAGDTKGIQRQWIPRNMIILRYKHEVITLEYYYIFCGIKLHRLFGYRLSGTWNMHNGLQERLQKWTNGRVIVVS